MNGSAIEGDGDRTTPPVRRRTKIVATLGPVSRDAPVLERLVEAGMDVARINLSHGSTAEHERSIVEVRAAAERQGSPLAVLIDLPGPKLRLGDLAGPITVKRGDIDRTRRDCSTPTCASISPSYWRTSPPASSYLSTTAP